MFICKCAFPRKFVFIKNILKCTQTIALNWIEMHSNKVSLPTIFIRFRHVHTQNAHFGYASDFVNILCFERFGFFLVGCLHFVALRQRSINLFPFIPIHIVSIHIVSLSLCLSRCTIFSNSPFIRSNDFQNFSFDTSCLILVCVVNSFFFSSYFLFILSMHPRCRHQE